MQYDVEFILTNSQLSSLQNNEDRALHIQTIFDDNDKVRTLLSSYHSGKPIDYAITNLEMEDNGTGWFSTDYTAEQYSGCRNINLDDSSDMEVAFSIDWQSGNICLTGETIAERDPDFY